MNQVDNRIHYKDCSRYNWHIPDDECDGARCEIAEDLCPVEHELGGQ